MRRLTLATVTTVLLLAGCTSSVDSGGSDGTTTPGDSSAAPTTASPKDAATPACREVWKAGQTLPADYSTCLEDGEAATPDVTACIDGSALVVHLDTFYAITGQKIVEPDVAPLQDTDEFGKAYEACTGE